MHTVESPLDTCVSLSESRGVSLSSVSDLSSCSCTSLVAAGDGSSDWATVTHVWDLDGDHTPDLGLASPRCGEHLWNELVDGEIGLSNLHTIKFLPLLSYLINLPWNSKKASEFILDQLLSCFWTFIINSILRIHGFNAEKPLGDQKSWVLERSYPH